MGVSQLFRPAVWLEISEKILSE